MEYDFFWKKILSTANVDLLKPSLYPELVFFFFSKIDLFDGYFNFLYGLVRENPSKPLERAH